MKTVGKLIVIGIVAGIVLAGLLQIIYKLCGSEAYILLYNIDYIPSLEQWNSFSSVGVAFHFIFCILSVLCLYYLLKPFGWEQRSLPYILIYTVGSGFLFFLTWLTDKPPAANDLEAWFYWTASHAVYSWIVASFIIRWVHQDQWLRGRNSRRSKWSRRRKEASNF